MLTDNGSNMIKAFNDSIEDILDFSNGENSRMLETEALDSAVEVDTEARIVSRLPLFNGMLEESFDEAELEDGQRAEGVPTLMQDIFDDEDEFENSEEEHFRIFGRQLRLRCIPHSLQCSLRGVVEKDAEFLQIKSKAFALVKKFSKSSVNARLKACAKKVLVKPANTRWNYVYYVYGRMLELRAQISAICKDEGWNELTNLEWKRVRNIQQLV
jgi:hypothetical protein